MSLTGNESAPDLIQNPAAPREKAPVAILALAPRNSVTYKPSRTSPIICIALLSPGRKKKLLGPIPGLPARPREALPVVESPSLFAEEMLSRHDLKTPFSITAVRRVRTPSPSNGVVPNPPGMVPSSTIVTRVPATRRPSAPDRNEVPYFSPLMHSNTSSKIETAASGSIIMGYP